MSKANALFSLLFVIQSSLFFVSAQQIDSLSFQESRPCETTIQYHVGYVDPAFDLSIEKFKEAIKTAGNLWSDAAGQTLIRYNKDGDVPINLIYSDQQRLAEDIETLRKEIDKRSARHDSLKRRVEEQEAICSKKSEELESQANRLTKLMEQYNRRVRQLNQRGDITDSEQAELEEQKSKLEAMQSDLRNKKQDVDDVCNEAERMIIDLNNRKEILNSDIATFNRKNEQLKEFKRGLYTKDGEIEKIEIYHYDNDKGLVLTLTHEIGHALGLHHSDDPQSIMFPRRTNQNGDTVALSKKDVKAIRKMCDR